MIKYLCIYFLLLFSATVYAQTYLNLTSTWTESSASCCCVGTCDILDVTHTLIGDTVINGKTYYKVYTSGTHSIRDLWLDSIVLVEPFIGQMEYIREEQKQFLQYRTSSQTEVILADFDLEVGDTAVNTNCQSLVIVDHIDTVYLNNEPRKRFYFSPGSPGWGGKTLIEGVGCSAGLFTFPCHEIGIESGSSLECFSQDGGQIVIDSTSACNTTSSTELSLTFQNAIQVFPNPADEYIEVRLTNQDWNRPSRISLYNLQGQLISTQSIEEQEESQRIDLSGLIPAIYFLYVNNGREFCVKKVVKGR